MDQKSPEPSVAPVPDPGELSDELTGHNPKRKRAEHEQILPKPKRKRPVKSSKPKKKKPKSKPKQKQKTNKKTTKKRRKQEPIKKAGTMLSFFGKKRS